jgi:hypothetical protein
MPSDGRLLMWDSLTLSIIMIDKAKESHMISQPPPESHVYVRETMAGAERVCLLSGCICLVTHSAAAS